MPKINGCHQCRLGLAGIALLALIFMPPVSSQQSGLDAPPYNATATCKGGQAAVGFISGLASGDATQDAVVIWTRYEPGNTADTFPVDYVVSTQPTLTPVVANGTVTARPEADFTVKVDINGLKPNSTYYYAFRQGNLSSPLGRTKTLPAMDQGVRQLRYAIVSCANWGYGYFNAYDMVARVRELDFVVHLGDFIYEYNTTYYPSEREKVRRELIPPRELWTLEDYQQRHRLQRTDPSLQELMRRVPMYIVWDDHDSADNAWKNGSYNTHDPAVWQRRKANAAQALLQYLPIREPGPSGDPFALYRSFTFGDLATFVLPETRFLYRTEQVDVMKHPYIETLEQNDPDEWDSLPQLPDLRRSYIDFLKAPNLTQIGPQVDMMRQDFAKSKAANVTWQIFASPTIFSPRRTPDIEAAIEEQYGSLVNTILDAFLNFSTSDIAANQLAFGGIARVMVGTGHFKDTLFTDSWDGYQFEREIIIDGIFSNGTNNAVVIVGDSHNAWASNLYRNMVQFTPNASVSTQSPVLGVEFATASITAPGTESYVDIIPFDNVLDVLEKGLFISNPELVYANLKDRGIVILTATKEGMQGDYYFVSTIKEHDYVPECKKSLKVVAGQMAQGLQNATCTEPGALLFDLYTSADPLPQEANLTSPGIRGAEAVSNCGPGEGTPPSIAVSFGNATEAQGGGGQEIPGLVSRVASGVGAAISGTIG